MRDPSEIEMENQRLETRMAEVAKNRDDLAEERETLLETNTLLAKQVCVCCLFSFG